ncbi:hypothetical protein G6F43_012394 [Rhizopus delemar]|nr:hypothetical protein G6F43_012394 [Rhizopus delemar]
MSVFSSRISPNQMGFMPQRFIGENGRLLQLIMTSASIQKSDAIGLLLDQEKAYDRIHPGYLTRVLCRFGVPPQLVDTIISLFFSTKISININGFLTDPFVAQRGLRQGDPLSPLLFNIAFDPFLRLISTDLTFHGFSFSTTSDGSYDVSSNGNGFSDELPDNNAPPPPVKILAYADDVLVLVNSPSDFSRLQWAVDVYTSASNALLNYNKTQAFSLSGQPQSTWQEFLAAHNILSWHDNLSTAPLIYLGYPVYSSIPQRNHFVDQLINKIHLSCQIHSQRNLSIRGRVTVLNCLIFSKLWHVLRLVPLTQTQLSKLQGIGSRFLNSNSFPRISFSTLSLPRSKGGLGALDPAVQTQALQWRWLNPMLLSTARLPNYSRLFPRSLFPSVTYGQYLLQITSPQYHSHPRISGSMALLFDSFRSQHFSSSTLHCFSSLFSALGSLLCRSFEGVSVSLATVLNLPLSSLVGTTPIPAVHPPLIPYHPPLPHICKRQTFRRMIGSNILIHDPYTNRLRYRSFTTIEIQQFSRTSKQLINLLTSNSIQLRQIASFHLTNTTNNYDLIDFTPIFLSIFNTESASLIHSHLFSTSPKVFKQLKLTKQNSSHLHLNEVMESTLPHTGSSTFISPSKWSAFWKLSIPLQSRTIWFKIIHRSIPHASLLHRFIPQKFLSALCPLCLNESDSITHFFYTCVKIQPIWIQIASLFIEQNWQHAIHFFLSDISSAVSHLATFPPRDPSIPLVPSLSTSQIVACVLQAIWSSRWQLIFHDVPFNHGTVSIQAQKYIYQLAAEIDLHDDAL